MISELKVQMGKRREFFVYALIFMIAGGSLFDIVADKEHWPFSPYPMFSFVRRDYSLNKLQLYCVTESEPPLEMPLDAQYIQPFNTSRLSAALEGMLKSASPNQHLNEVLQDILVRYEVLHCLGRHNGPPLRGIRLYRLYWHLNPWARNVERPDRRKLILEIMGPTKR